MSREEEIRSILKQMLRKLENKIRRREDKIYDLEELLKAKDEKLRKAEERAKKPCFWNKSKLKILSRFRKGVCILSGVTANMAEHVSSNMFLRFVG